MKGGGGTGQKVSQWGGGCTGQEVSKGGGYR